MLREGQEKCQQQHGSHAQTLPICIFPWWFSCRDGCFLAFGPLLPCPRMMSKNCALAGFVAPESFAKPSLTVSLRSQSWWARRYPRISAGMNVIMDCIPASVTHSATGYESKQIAADQQRHSIPFSRVQWSVGGLTKWPARLERERVRRLRTLPGYSSPWACILSQVPHPEQFWFKATPVTLSESLGYSAD